MFGSIASGTTEIHNFLEGARLSCNHPVFRTLGIDIEEKDSTVLVHGKGLHGLSAPTDILDVGNSGTTTRLLSGILVGQPFESKLSGDESLNSRPMKRIIDPPDSDGSKYIEHPAERMRPAVHFSRQPSRNPLQFSCCLRTGKVLYPAGRAVCRRRNFRHRAVPFQEPYRA